MFTLSFPTNRKAEEKKKQELEDAKKAIAAASRMKGKSGKDLFNQLVASNADLFLDDDDADDDCAYPAHALFPYLRLGRVMSLSRRIYLKSDC
jgi:hypothetical protein